MSSWYPEKSRTASPLRPEVARELNSRRKTPYKFGDPLFILDDSASDGVSVTAYGRGQLSGATFTVPAFSTIDLDLTMRLLCVTPDDVNTLSSLIRSLLDASHQHSFDDLQKTDISGGLSLGLFFSFGVSASYSDTKHTMDSWGLSERNQEAIVDAMMKIANTWNVFNYKGTVHNENHDFSVSGSLFGIVMDCTIQQGESHNQIRTLAPQPHLAGNDGTNLPTTGKLYN